MHNVDVCLLTGQQAETDELVEKLETATTRSAKYVLFGELADKLAAHMTVEEEIFYLAIFVKGLEDKLREATEEHLAIKCVLADLMTMDPMDPQFAAKLEVMGEQLSHHAHEEEEGELFPELRTMLTFDELVALGGEMLSKFETLLAMNPGKQVAAETDRAAALDA